MSAEDVLVPLIIFSAIVLIVGIVMRYRAERARVQAAGGDEYRKLAEEAVRSQRAMLDEVQRMNATLREIEKLLREV